MGNAGCTLAASRREIVTRPGTVQAVNGHEGTLVGLLLVKLGLDVYNSAARAPLSNRLQPTSGTDVVPTFNSVRYYFVRSSSPFGRARFGGRRDAEHAAAVRSRKARPAIPRRDFAACDPRWPTVRRRTCAPGMCRTHASLSRGGTDRARAGSDFPACGAAAATEPRPPDAFIHPM
jgi:hypothetical protein